MNAERAQSLVLLLQDALSLHVEGNGTLTLNFQNGRLSTASVLLHTRLSAVDKPTAPRAD